MGSVGRILSSTEHTRNVSGAWVQREERAGKCNEAALVKHTHLVLSTKSLRKVGSLGGKGQKVMSGSVRWKQRGRREQGAEKGRPTVSSVRGFREYE
jgi:hypothetical protein